MSARGQVLSIPPLSHSWYCLQPQKMKAAIGLSVRAELDNDQRKKGDPFFLGFSPQVSLPGSITGKRMGLPRLALTNDM